MFIFFSLFPFFLIPIRKLFFKGDTDTGIALDVSGYEIPHGQPGHIHVVREVSGFFFHWFDTGIVTDNQQAADANTDESTCCDFYIPDKRDEPVAAVVEKREPEPEPEAAEDASTCCDFYIPDTPVAAVKREPEPQPEPEPAEDESTCCDFYIPDKRDGPVAAPVEKREPEPEAAEEDSTCCDFYIPDKREEPVAAVVEKREVSHLSVA